MIVKIKYALPQLLCPTIEKFIIDEPKEYIIEEFKELFIEDLEKNSDKLKKSFIDKFIKDFDELKEYVVGGPKECIGDIFGYHVKNRYKENMAIITDVFTYNTPKANTMSIEELEKPEWKEICENLEDLLEDHKIRLGDYHTHIDGEILDAYGEKTQKEFIKKFMNGTKYSPDDKKVMKKTGELYLIVGFGKKILPHKKSLYICPDKKSLFGVLQDFVYCVSAFYYSRKAKRFKKALVTL